MQTSHTNTHIIKHYEVHQLITKKRKSKRKKKTTDQKKKYIYYMSYDELLLCHLLILKGCVCVCAFETPRMQEK